MKFHFFVPIKRTEILFTKSGFQVHNVTVSFGGQAPPGPGGCRWRSIHHSRKPLRWILRGPTCRERREQRRDGNKEEGGKEGEMEKRGEEGEGRDGSLHPLEFSKVGAYGGHPYSGWRLSVRLSSVHLSRLCLHCKVSN